MKKIGLFYGTSTKKTADVAQKILSEFKKEEIDAIATEEAWEKDFEKYDNILIGASTWFDGELPTYWDEIRPILESLDMTGKKVAIFGLGDQEGYPDNFVDAIGILAELFESAGAQLVGFTSPEGYTFGHSKALRDGKLLGLAIDVENQADKTDRRVKEWVKEIKTEYS